MKIFENAEGEGDAPYLVWTREHTLGFVLTTSRGRSPYYMMLHTAACPKINVKQSNYGPNAFTANAYIKACTTVPAELLEFCRMNGRLDHPTPCSVCNPNPNYAADLDLGPLADKAATEGQAKPTKRKFEIERFNRSLNVSLLAKKLANGVCALCEEPAPFEDDDGPFLESHHVVHLSRGGPDVISNVVALCPNCHRRMHSLDRADEVEKLTQAALQRARSAPGA